MSDTELAGALTAAAGVVVAAITGFLGYRSARWSVRKDLEVELRHQRLAAFKRLWALSEPLAKYGRPATTAMTAASLDALSNELSHWYFTQGGMFLSEPSRKAYFAFQDALQGVVRTRDQDEVLDPATREDVREKGSDLRDALRAAFKGFPQM
jgi:hypothetical protein